LREIRAGLWPLRFSVDRRDDQQLQRLLPRNKLQEDQHDQECHRVTKEGNQLGMLQQTQFLHREGWGLGVSFAHLGRPVLKDGANLQQAA
jgi:hypothetical protein